MEFVALGGAIDPEKRLPPIGGSAYAFIDEKTRSALLVDYGAYPLPEQKRQWISNKILSLPRKEERVEIGGREFPVLPRLGAIVEANEEYYALTRECFPDPSVLYDMKHIFVLGSHAHTDHIGGLPYLKRIFPQTEIWMTEPTLDIARWSWYDARRIAQRKKAEMFYSGWDIDNTLKTTKIMKDNQPFSCGPFRVEPHDSGHILGARSFAISYANAKGPRVFCTGDISFDGQKTVRGAILPEGPFDYVVSEATYAGKTRDARKTIEKRIIADVMGTLEAGGKVLFPVLTVGRSMEVFELLIAAKIPEKFPLYIDGAARDIGNIYLKYSAVYPSLKNHLVSSQRMRERIVRSKKPLIILAPSGMLVGGYSVAYFTRLADEEKNLIVLTSYQDPCCPGYRIEHLPKGTLVVLGDRERKVKVRLEARVAHHALSAHASNEQLLKMIEVMRPRERTFLVHGEEGGMNDLIAETSAEVGKTYIGNLYSL